MHTILQREVMLRDAVYNIAKLAREEDPEIERVYIETSDQGNYLTATRVAYDEGDDDANYLDEQLDSDVAVSIEDWASSLSWDDANDTVAGWHVTNGHGGYYYIDVAEALAVEAPVEIKPVDLVTGVLALHIPSHRPLDDKKACLCGEHFEDLMAFRQHLAEKIVEVLS
jgi:hypothetical protein